MYSLNFQVTTSTCDAEGRLKLFSALQMMQDCSEMWIESEPRLKAHLRETGMAQLLASRQVEVARAPLYGEKLTVTTSVFDVKPMFGFRNTVISDEAGLPCYKSWSMGAFVDRRSGRLCRLDESVAKTLTFDERLPMDYKDRHIPVPGEAGMESHPAVAVERNDIDYNRHMNNANYIRLALELLPEGFPVRELRVEFKAPARLGDALLPQTLLAADGSFYAVLRLGGAVSSVMQFWR